MAEYIEAAIVAGIDEIGLSDHAPIFHLGGDPHPVPSGAMSRHDLDDYFAEAVALRETYAGRIDVRVGIESDFVPGWDTCFRDFWRKYPVDYVIGSIHWVQGWNIFNTRPHPTLTATEVITEYLMATQQAAASGAYDIIGHLDGIKTNAIVENREITSLFEDTVKILAKSDITIELNTSGWRSRCNEPHPKRDLLALCHHYNVPITLGSDAHSPEQVASHFDEAIALMKEVGYREIAVFNRRVRRMAELK